MAELSTSALAGRYRLAKSDEWRDLLTHLDFGEGFSLVVLLAPDRYGVEICRAELESHLAAKKLHVHPCRISVDDPPEELARRLKCPFPDNTGAVWVEMVPQEAQGRVAETAEAFDEPEKKGFRDALRALNPERNLLQGHLRTPLIIAGPVWLQTVFREAAPDLWSIRSTVINIHPDLDVTRRDFGELEMPVEKSFEAPDEATVERAAQLWRDLERIEGKSGAELLRAELLRRLGVELTNLLRWEESERVLTEAYRLGEEFHAAAQDHAIIARDLGRILQVRDPRRARHYFEVALRLEEAAFGREGSRYGRACSDLGILLYHLGNYPQAETFLRESLRIAETVGDQRGLGADLNNVALLLKATNRLVEAEPLMRRALAIDERTYGAEHPDVATRLNNLASLLNATNRLAEAEPLMRRALAIDEKNYGPEHPRVAIRLNNLAQWLQATNRLDEAEPLMRRTLEVDEKSYGPDHSEVATDLNNLAVLLQATNRLSEAEPLIRRALAIDEKNYGLEHPKVAIRLNSLASLLNATNRPTEAESLMRRALEVDEKSYGAEHPEVAIDLNNLAQLLGATNRLSEAEPLMRRALDIGEKSDGLEHPNVAIRLSNLALLLRDTNRLAEAKPLMRRALAIALRCQFSWGRELREVDFRSTSYREILRKLGWAEGKIDAEMAALTEECRKQVEAQRSD